MCQVQEGKGSSGSDLVQCVVPAEPNCPHTLNLPPGGLEVGLVLYHEEHSKKQTPFHGFITRDKNIVSPSLGVSIRDPDFIVFLLKTKVRG